jgi:hypothetical protein
MNDALASSTARALALHRWGSQRLERMAAELVERRDELDSIQRDRLERALVGDTPEQTITDGEGPEAVS